MVRRLPLLLLHLVALAVIAACDRKDSKQTTVADAAPSSSAAPLAPVVSSAPHVDPESLQVAAPPVSPVEARRTEATRAEDDSALLAAVDAMKKHYGGQLPKKMAVQSTDRPEGWGRALIVSDATKPPPGDPFAIAVDGHGAVKWTKERPAAGILAPIGPYAIAAGPKGRIALAVCDPPTTRVALRMWDDDGSPFADYDAMDIDDCSSMSLLYWPRRGFVIVATRGGTTKAQLVSENGALQWRRGIEIGARSVTGAPASIAADSDESFVLVQYGAVTAEPGARVHALAFRFDLKGAPLWTSPSDLGVAPVDRPADDRIVLTRPKVGQIRATLSKDHVADVSSNGTVTVVSQFKQ